MSGIRQLALLIGLSSLLAGVESPTLAATPFRAETVHVVGVYSRPLDSIEVKSLGVFALGDSSIQVNGAEWGIDQVVEAEAESALSGSFVLKPTDLNPVALADVHDSLFGGVAPSLGKAVRALPPAGIDAYLIFLPDVEVLQYPLNGRSRVGLGVIKGFARRDLPAAIHLNYTVYLVDAKTGEVIAQEQGTHDKHGQFMSSYVPMELTDTSWPGKWADATDEQRSALQAKLMSMFKDSLGYTLRKMAASRALGGSPGEHSFRQIGSGG